jgi:hypothetical protein
MSKRRMSNKKMLKRKTSKRHIARSMLRIKKMPTTGNISGFSTQYVPSSSALIELHMFAWANVIVRVGVRVGFIWNTTIKLNDDNDESIEWTSIFSTRNKSGSQEQNVLKWERHCKCKHEFQSKQIKRITNLTWNQTKSMIDSIRIPMKTNFRELGSLVNDVTTNENNNLSLRTNRWVESTIPMDWDQLRSMTIGYWDRSVRIRIQQMSPIDRINNQTHWRGNLSRYEIGFGPRLHKPRSVDWSLSCAT